MILTDIIERVQAKLDDPEGTYITPDYVLGHAQDAYETLYNGLRASGFQFDEEVIVLPGVAAGTPDLDAFMATGKELEVLVRPRLVEWRLPGQPDTSFRVADGPLEAVRDLAAGQPRLDSWAWMRRSVKLSSFTTALDLRLTGEFLFPPLTAGDSPVQMDITIGPALTLAITVAIAKARGNQTWVTQYSADLGEAQDSLFIAMVKEQQAVPYRLARNSRRRRSGAAATIR